MITAASPARRNTRGLGLPGCGAGVTLPMHYDTFDLIAVDAGAFVRRVREQVRKAEIVEPGGDYTLD